MADAVVVGGGIAGLAAAYAFGRAGLRPLLLEARSVVGGLVFGGTVGGVRVDLGAESFATRGTGLPGLLADLGLETVLPADRSWVRDGATGVDVTFPIPDGILGIPIDPADRNVIAVLGTEAAARAAEEPDDPQIGADSPDLAGLVAARMGPAVVDTLVRPVCTGVLGAPPERLAVDVAVPGLVANLRRTGSLAGAIRVLKQGTVAPVASVAGGMFRLSEELAAEVGSAGGQVRTDARVRSVEPDAGIWRVRYADGSRTVETRRLVLAAPMAGVAGWVQQITGESVEVPTPRPMGHVTLAVAGRALPDAVRGSGVLVVGTSASRAARSVGSERRVKAVTHTSVKWPWLPTDPQILRVSYDLSGDGDPAAGVLAGGAVEVGRLALADAADVLGVDLTPDDLIDQRVVRFDDGLVSHTPEHRATVARVCAALPGGVALTGGWVAGSGLAALVPHAISVAEELL